MPPRGGLKPGKAIRRGKYLARRARGLFRRVRRRILGSGVYSFTEKTQLTSIVVPGTAGSNTTYGTITYKLDDLVNVTAFANIFDLYKISGVKLTLVPLASQSTVSDVNNVSQQGGLPMLYIAPNRDILVPAPVSTADVINDDGCKIIRLEKPVSFYLSQPKPYITDDQNNLLPLQQTVYQNYWLSTGGNAQVMNQSNVKHYGHRFALTNNMGTELVVQVYVKYYFQLKEQD